MVCDIPLGPLADEAPLLRAALRDPESRREPLTDIPESTDIAADLLKLMASPNLASRRWVWEQYDQSVGADTVQRPGGDAAVVRVHGSKKALAITTDCTPRYCYADPVEGGKQAVAEAYRNLCAVGAKPLAITNCLNFGNPQRPEIMGQFVGCVEGMAEACRALDFPVVSGNVSLYNETKNEDGSSLAILPTPAIGGVGLLDDWEKSATIGFKAEAERILLIGADHTKPAGARPVALARSLSWAARRPAAAGQILRPNTARVSCVRKLIDEGLVTAVHDVSDGGILVAVAEMALAGDIGARLTVESFEDHVDREKMQPGRVAVRRGPRAIRRHRTAQPARWSTRLALDAARRFAVSIGWTGGDAIVIDFSRPEWLAKCPSPTSAPRTRASSPS